ncbi:MAG: glycosyltransferase family 4 protein, partial [Gammaproteobacteria bacterium]
MKLLLVIDHLGMGGAQRQLVELACGLARRGHQIEIFVYFPQYDFFRKRVEAQGIRVIACEKGGGFSTEVWRQLVRLRRGGGFDLVVSFLNSPNVYTELAKIAAPGIPLVVSERCTSHDDATFAAPLARRLLHAVADHVVTNSETHARWLNLKPWLRGKASCIYNGVDLESLRLGEVAAPVAQELRLLAVGRICPQKNLLNLIAALGLFHQQRGFVPCLSWAGKQDDDVESVSYRKLIDGALEKLPQVREQWHWLGQQADMPGLFRTHDALIHPSFYEGLPNAVCEALAAGKPVLVSNVCDHPLLVAEGKRGFLFDPADPTTIAAAMGKVADLDAAGRLAFA